MKAAPCRCWICLALDRAFPGAGEQLALFSRRSDGRVPKGQRPPPTPSLAEHIVTRKGTRKRAK